MTNGDPKHAGTIAALGGGVDKVQGMVGRLEMGACMAQIGDKKLSRERKLVTGKNVRTQGSMVLQGG